MKFKFSLCCFVLLFTSAACQKYSIDNMPIDQIHFGEGGGITGAITEYCLLKNGQLFNKKHFTEDYKSFKKIKKRTAKKLYKTCKKIELQEVQIDNPGDKYYYIAYETKGFKHKITWGGNQQKPPIEVIELYAALKVLTTEE